MSPSRKINSSVNRVVYPLVRWTFTLLREEVLSQWTFRRLIAYRSTVFVAAETVTSNVIVTRRPGDPIPPTIPHPGLLHVDVADGAEVDMVVDPAVAVVAVALPLPSTTSKLFHQPVVLPLRRETRRPSRRGAAYWGRTSDFVLR